MLKYSISFNPQSYWLAVSSDKGTVHVYSIKDKCAPDNNNNQVLTDQLDTKAPDLSNMPSKNIHYDHNSIANDKKTDNLSHENKITTQNPRSSLSFLKNFYLNTLALNGHLHNIKYLIM